MELLAESNKLKHEITYLKEIKDSELENLLLELPNIPINGPVGSSEQDNIVIQKVGVPTKFNFEPKSHYELGLQLGMMDFETAAKMSGSRFVLLKGKLARLERAIGQFMLDTHTTKFGYLEVSPPLLVLHDTMKRVGQLPKFDEESFKVDEKYRLIPTSEVPLVHMFAEEILKTEELPIRVTALTPCFRSEAGSAGKDTRGMIRHHQFYKVELVSITTQESSEDEHKRMLEAACYILNELELPYQVSDLCSGDLGFCSHRTFDIEVWLPAEQKYREISSCSNFGSFSAVRMNTRYKEQNDKKHTKYVHTLNGSGLAVGRSLIAIMENYQNEDGSIRIPKILQKYLNGEEVINI